MERTISPNVSFDEGFWPSVYSLDPANARKVVGSLNLFRDNPAHPNLHLKPLRGELSQFWSARAGRDTRILMVRRGDTFIWLEAGLRRDIYDKAQRARFLISPHRKRMVFVDPLIAPEDRRRAVPTGDEVVDAQQRGVFDHWTTSELADAGFGAAEAASLRSLTDEYDILTLPFSASKIDLAATLLELTPEQWRETKEAPVEPAAEERMLRAIDEFGGLTGISPVFSRAELERIAAAPIEDWMVFLHPDQRAVVEREFDGPARVRGAAGTGKTVVALHRAASLARRYCGDGGLRVLFTTYIESLPPVFEGLYHRLPEAIEGAVDFTHVNQLAWDICDRAGETPHLHLDAIDESFDSACDELLPVGSPLEQSGVSRGYVRTEIEKVIKGRGLATVDSYLTVARTGRQVGFTQTMRRQVWEIAEAWAKEMVSRNTTGFPDVVLRAAEIASGFDEPLYRAVIVDEAQDLTLAGLQLLRVLVNGPSGVDRPDGLFIVGDGAQRVYPGGFTLRQAGVEVRGRTTVLKVNYRNTAEIIGAALAAAGAEQVVDLDEEFKRRELIPVTTRHGVQPRLAKFTNTADERQFLVQQIQATAESTAVGLGDVAVFTPTVAESMEIADELERAGIPVLDLRRYKGRPTNEVKVGTYQRAKGLEFKAVFLPGLSTGAFPGPRTATEGEEEFGERSSLELGQLFVAMTRARDALFVSCVGGLPQAVASAADRFELVG